MKNNGRIYGLFGAIGMAMLILDSKTALSGAAQGLTLCIQSVIPSLFPFFFLSSMLTAALSGRRLPIPNVILRLLKIPEGGESLLIVALLGGYPVGAAGIADAAKRGQLPVDTARRMLGFCNNAGPSFLFGIIAGLFPQYWMAWALWGIHMTSSLLVGILLPGKLREKISVSASRQPSIMDSLSGAIKTMTTVCGWVVLFRILIAFLDRWLFWALPNSLTVVISGLLELTNGCCMLATVPNTGLRFILCSGMLAFGGLCVGMQTVTVTASIGSGMYFPGKLLQMILSVALASLIQTVFPDHVQISPTVFLFLAGSTGAVVCIFLASSKKEVAFREKLMYNQRKIPDLR